MDVISPEVEAQFRLALNAERERLQATIRELGEEGRILANAEGDESGAGGQTADVASDLLEHEIDITLERSMGRTLEDVDAALERMTAGTFGRCERCGDPILIERLQAIPWARHCMKCASTSQR